MSLQPILLNDLHSRLNLTLVHRLVRPSETSEVVAMVRQARVAGASVSVSGGRHSMGGQQFGTRSWHLDMRGMNRFLSLDRERRLARVQAGMTWPELLTALEAAQVGHQPFLTFRQKQTGADDLTLGGAVSSNIHGRGLAWAPLVADIESVSLITARGDQVRASRNSDPALFRLVVGGYGLFGIITELELRLVPRMRVQRVVAVHGLDGLAARFNRRVNEGHVMGDFQFCPDEQSEVFLTEGVFACYRPIDDTGTPPDTGLTLKPADWRKLLVDAHRKKADAWTAYTRHYLRTHGQPYSHDRAQLGYYDPDYARWIHQALPHLGPGSLMITELYVPRQNLETFMIRAAKALRRQRANLIYGTIRLIEADTETFIPWARRNFACVVMNLRVEHSAEGLARAAAAFRCLIDHALDLDGSFYLTYHRWASLDQVHRAYPRFADFLREKLQYDPDELFQSDWYRHWVSDKSLCGPTAGARGRGRSGGTRSRERHP